VRRGTEPGQGRHARDVARRILAGELSEARLEALPSAAAIEILRALPGIGPWSAWLILLRGLRRMEIFPDGDVGVAKNLGRHQRPSVSWSRLSPHVTQRRVVSTLGMPDVVGCGIAHSR